MFNSIWIHFLEILNNISSNRIFKKLTPKLILILKKIHPFKKASCWRHSQDWASHFFQNPKELGELINKENLVHKFLPKQTDIDKILDVIQRKVLKGTHLPIDIREIQVGYLYSPYFKDLYQYLSQNKLPSSKSAIRKLKTLSEKYVLLDLLLFRISPERDSNFSSTRNVHG